MATRSSAVVRLLLLGAGDRRGEHEEDEEKPSCLTRAEVRVCRTRTATGMPSCMPGFELPLLRPPRSPRRRTAFGGGLDDVDVLDGSVDVHHEEQRDVSP
jgi:hypothetical protein